MDELPLIPQPSVLFPGGELRLRICEPRHSDVIRWCAREARPFGACLVMGGDGEPAVPAAIGTLAHIVDFYSLPDGLLGIRAEGAGRFHVRRTRVRDNGLIVADVDPLEEPDGHVVRPEHALLVMLLDHLLEQFGGPHAKAPRACFDEAGWVGFRLAELLPLTDDDRQELLQYDDPHRRLDRIVRRLPELRA